MSQENTNDSSDIDSEDEEIEPVEDQLESSTAKKSRNDPMGWLLFQNKEVWE